MKTALQVLDRFEKVNVLKAAQTAMQDTAIYAEDAQRKQLFQGLNSDDLRIKNLRTGSSQYAPLTVEIKTAKGQPTNRITLKDIGDYYSGIQLKVKGNLFVIRSVDEKGDYLTAVYDPLGLGRFARTDWIPYLRPAFVKEIKSYLST